MVGPSATLGWGVHALGLVHTTVSGSSSRTCPHTPVTASPTRLPQRRPSFGSELSAAWLWDRGSERLRLRGHFPRVPGPGPEARAEHSRVPASPRTSPRSERLLSAGLLWVETRLKSGCVRGRWPPPCAVSRPSGWTRPQEPGRGGQMPSLLSLAAHAAPRGGQERKAPSRTQARPEVWPGSVLWVLSEAAAPRTSKHSFHGGSSWARCSPSRARVKWGEGGCWGQSPRTLWTSVSGADVAEAAASSSRDLGPSPGDRRAAPAGFLGVYHGVLRAATALRGPPPQGHGACCPVRDTELPRCGLEAGPRLCRVVCVRDA